MVCSQHRQNANAVQLEPLWTLAVLEATDNSGAEVRRTSFHNGYARAFMIKGRDAVFDSNVFDNAGGLHIGPEVCRLRPCHPLPLHSPGLHQKAQYQMIPGVLGGCIFLNSFCGMLGPAATPKRGLS